MKPWILPVLVLLIAGALASCGGGGNDGSPDPTGWRSVLFPADWTPEYVHANAGSLHDFSYAGYANGETALPDSAALPVFSVLDFGADPTGALDSAAGLQGALDAAVTAGGGVVRLPAGHYRSDGLLTITGSGVLIRGDGPGSTFLHFTKHTGISDRSHLHLKGTLAHGPDRPLAVDAASRATEILIDDATGLAVGDDVAIGCLISDAFIADHGMTGVWQAFNGTWQPFFRREITAINDSVSPARITLNVPLRYPMRIRDAASLRVETGHLESVGVEDLALSNAAPWDDAWSNDRAHVLELSGVKDAWVKNVHSFASPESPTSGDGDGAHLASGGIIVRFAKRVTIADCRMEEAEHRGGGGNGYLFEVRQSNEILFRDCVARRGRHNFIQNWGFGVTGCVWLRCSSREGQALNLFLGILVPIVGYSEYHHSLATANLVDSCVVDDGWSAVNRGLESTGAGHTATENVFWNTTGTGLIRSAQFGRGYVIGTGPDLRLSVTTGDFLEGEGDAANLEPRSLYRDQFERRTGKAPESP